jgi:hypothetical protein
MVGVSRVVVQEPVEALKTLMHRQERAGDKERIQLLYLLKSGQAESVTRSSDTFGGPRHSCGRGKTN